MKKAIKPMIGDEVITTDKFTLGKGMNGVVRDIIDKNLFAVEFEEEKEGMHKFDDILIQPNGYCLEVKDIEIINRYKNKNKEKEQFVSVLRTQYFKRLLQLPKRTKDIDRNIKHTKGEIKSYDEQIKRSTAKYKQFEKEKIYIANQLEEMPNNQQFVRQFDKLSSHPIIEKIQIEKDWLVVTTKDLTYHDTRTGSKLPEFILGAYYLFIDLKDSTRRPIIINFKRQIHKGHYFHPCVERGGNICLGQRIGSGIDHYQKKHQYMELIYLLLNFLQEPNYRGPFISATNFFCAQQVTIKPKNILDWMKSSEWEKETFNSRKFDEDIKKVKEKYSITSDSQDR